MAENTIVAVCPNCKEQYELPADYAGQKAECEKCNTEFVIEDSAGVADDTSTRKITKIQRTGHVNMVPQVEDDFQLSVQQTTTSQRSLEMEEAIRQEIEKRNAPPPKKPWWKIW